jgi:hypothetical protein
MIPNLDGFYILVSVLFILFIPLGLWKLVEIIIWTFNHVHFS